MLLHTLGKDQLQPTRRSCVILLAATSALPVVADAQARISLKFTKIGQGPDITRVESVLRSAYEKLGVDVEYVAFPAERAIVESNTGHADGETARIAGMDVQYTNLLRIDVPLFINTNSVFVYGAAKAAPASLEQVARLERVGFIRGRKVLEDATAGWKNVQMLNSFESGLKMLKLGRLDAFLGRTEDVLFEIQQAGLSAADYPHSVVLRNTLYHYLHKRHAALAPAIERELLRLKGNRAAVVDVAMS